MVACIHITDGQHLQAQCVSQQYFKNFYSTPFKNRYSYSNSQEALTVHATLQRSPFWQKTQNQLSMTSRFASELLSQQKQHFLEVREIHSCWLQHWQKSFQMQQNVPQLLFVPTHYYCASQIIDEQSKGRPSIGHGCTHVHLIIFANKAEVSR